MPFFFGVFLHFMSSAAEVTAENEPQKGKKLKSGEKIKQRKRKKNRKKRIRGKRHWPLAVHRFVLDKQKCSAHFFGFFCSFFFCSTGNAEIFYFFLPWRRVFPTGGSWPHRLVWLFFFWGFFFWMLTGLDEEKSRSPLDDDDGGDEINWDCWRRVTNHDFLFFYLKKKNKKQMVT